MKKQTEQEIPLKICDLVYTLNYATKFYDEGKPIMSDERWDALYFKLQKWENENKIYHPESPTQKVNYQVVNQLNKVTHEVEMLSLDKTKDDSKYKEYFGDKDYVNMLKLDGLTLAVKYEDAKLVSAETRGNGIVGEDVLHNASAIPSIPNRININEPITLHGEIICLKEDFEGFKKDYANPRNFAAGSIRLLDSKECSRRKLTFVVWNVVKGLNDIKNFSEKLSYVSTLGFNVVPFKKGSDKDSIEWLKKEAEERGIPIDGIVGRFEDIEYGNSLGSTGHHSKAAYAFKFYDEEYETKLINIEWSMGRTGVLTPIAVFEPIDTGDSIINKASLSNVSIAYDTLGVPYIGQKIYVSKRNQIIPKVERAENKYAYDNIPTWLDGNEICPISACPICGEPVKIKDNNDVRIMICTNSNCEGKLINKIEHFCGKKGLDIKGISKKTLEKLIDWEWVSKIEDIFDLQEKRSEWIKKSGFGAASVDKILNAIEESRTCELSSFICALGIPLIGSTASKVLAKEFKTWDNFYSHIEDKKYSFENLDSFGIEMNDSIKNFDYLFAQNLLKKITINEESSENLKNTLEGITVVITGKINLFKNRDELKSKIEDLGGKVTGSVSKKTNYLINNDVASNSSKNVKAKELGVEVISESDFINKFF